MKYFILLLAVASFLPLATPLLAQEPTPYELLAPLPLPKSGCTDTSVWCWVTAGPYIEDMFVLIIQIAGVLAVVVLIYGGIKYMTTDAIGGKSEAKDVITNALWGLLLVISAWLILYTINPDLTTFKLQIQDPTVITP